MRQVGFGLRVVPFLLLAPVVAGRAPAAAHDLAPAIADVVAPLLPGVVRIIIWAPADAATPVGPDGVKPDRAQFFGSGFVIDPSGIIVRRRSRKRPVENP